MILIQLATGLLGGPVIPECPEGVLYFYETDWYNDDGIGVRGVKFAAAEGNVCGTGPDAAAVTGLVRHALQASAQQSRDPATMLGVADAVLSENQLEEMERFCTATCAVIRPGRAVRVTLAGAGHPPPLVLHADGSVEEIACRGALLGVGMQMAGDSRRWLLHPGDRLILYTDSLIEARDSRRRFFGDGPLADFWPPVPTTPRRSSASTCSKR
jgi:sigma-B regulation protein RsbU (phosphoserine phosphatase)